MSQIHNSIIKTQDISHQLSFILNLKLIYKLVKLLKSHGLTNLVHMVIQLLQKSRRQDQQQHQRELLLH